MLILGLSTLPPPPPPPFPPLHCIILCCFVLYCIAFHPFRCVALPCLALPCLALHCIAVQCSAVQCSRVHCSAVHCSALHCIAWHCIPGFYHVLLCRVVSWPLFWCHVWCVISCLVMTPLLPTCLISLWMFLVSCLVQGVRLLACRFFPCHALSCCVSRVLLSLPASRLVRLLFTCHVASSCYKQWPMNHREPAAHVEAVKILIYNQVMALFWIERSKTLKTPIMAYVHNIHLLNLRMLGPNFKSDVSDVTIVWAERS